MQKNTSEVQSICRSGTLLVKVNLQVGDQWALTGVLFQLSQLSGWTALESVLFKLI